MPAREVFVSTAMRHQLVAVTALHNNVPWYAMLVEGRFKDIRPPINDPQELYDLRADPEELRKDCAGLVDGMPAVREVR